MMMSSVAPKLMENGRKKVMKMPLGTIFWTPIFIPKGLVHSLQNTHNYNLNTNHSVVVNCKIHWLCNELSILLVRAKHEEKRGPLYSKRRNLSLKFPTRLEFLACWLCSSDLERKKARFKRENKCLSFLKKKIQN